MKLMTLLFSLMITVATGFGVSSYFGIDPGAAIAGTAGAAVGLSLVKEQLPSGIAFAGVLTEVWTAELIKQFRAVANHFGRIPDFSSDAENDVIHLVDVGADPAVLINNTTYPIPNNIRVDQDVAISLDKFDTENTRIPEDELIAISYDKMASVIEQHRDTLIEGIADKGTHALAPADDTLPATPVVKTTGADDGLGMKKITNNDVIELKRQFDNQKIPAEGRVLVLHPNHVAQLLATVEAFLRQFQIDTGTGMIGARIWGFEVWEYPTMPAYSDTFVKNPFGQVFVPGTDRDASIAFFAPRMFKANGTTSFFQKLASEDPEFRETLIGFRQRNIILPKKNEGFAAIVGADV